jgi:hypothetical protein
MFFEGQDGLSHLRQVRPPIVDCFHLRLHRRGVIYQPLSDIRRSSDLSVHAPICSAEIFVPLRSSALTAAKTDCANAYVVLVSFEVQSGRVHQRMAVFVASPTFK